MHSRERVYSIRAGKVRDRVPPRAVVPNLGDGAHHRETLSSVAWLASVLQELGRSEEAKPLYLDVLAHDRHMGGDARRDGTLRPMFKV